MSKYTVTAQRTPRWWVLQAVEAPGAISQVARLDQAEQIIEAIAFVTGEAESDIEIEVRPELPEEFERHFAHMRSARAQAEEASVIAAYEAHDAAAVLAEHGLSMRDIGTVMNVSHQRVQQILSGSAA